jgi:hypothetical protein
MPDQIQAAESIPGGIKNSKVEIYKSLDQVINSMKFSVGIGDALGLFMLSPSLKLAHSTLVNTSRYIEEVTAHVSAYRCGSGGVWLGGIWFRRDLVVFGRVYWIMVACGRTVFGGHLGCLNWAAL